MLKSRGRNMTPAGNHSTAPNFTHDSAHRPRFLDWCACRLPSPDDALAAYFDDAVLAAQSAGATLDHLPILDGRRHYLPNLAGRNERKQFYIGNVQTDKDGTSWPAITFKSFKRAEDGTFWKPRDLAWQHYQQDRGEAVPDAEERRAAYRAKIEAAAAAAAAAAAEDERTQAEGRAAAAAVAVEAWEAAEACEVHGYLSLKSVVSHGLRVARRNHRARLWNDEAGHWQDVVAVRSGDLLIPMSNEAGQLVNVQRIDASGKKRFVMGGRAHGCHFRIEGHSGRVALAEGYATGSTWAAATGDTVVLAFSAGALAVVAGYVQADLVAADNDASGTGEKAAKATGLPYHMPPIVGADWNDFAAHDLAAVLAAVANDNAKAYTRPYGLPAVELKGREQTWWNKLASADTPEAAAAWAWAIGRRLCVRVPVQMALDDLISQLRDTAPAGMMNSATVEAIKGTLARLIDWRKRRAMAGINMSAEALARHRVETVPELPELDDEDYSGVLLLASPMGSGKTQRVGRPFADWAKHQDARFVATCHRQSLVAELAHRLACDHYQDTDAELAWAVQAFATCLPSLVKDAHAQIIDEAGFVFIDEIAQVLRSVAAKVTVADQKNRSDVYRALRDLVSRAKCVIGADAGMDDRVLAFLESCRPGERFRVIQQPHTPAGMSVSFGFGHDALATAYGEALARLSQGERLWIGCGEKSRAIEAARVLGSTGARVLLLHGDNRENAEQAEFWRDPEAVSRTYDCVVHTSVISSGMSIEHRDGAHFTHGMFFGSGATITPADALQMLRRVRYLKTWTIAATPNNARDMDNADAILAGMEQSANLEGLTLKSCTDFDGFAAGIEADNARHRADFASGLWWALESQCFDVQRMTTVLDEDMTATLKAVRAEIRAEQRAAILAAHDLTDDEAKRLRERTVRTEAEQVALLRHRIKTDLGMDDLSDDDLDDWDDGRGPQQMDRFSAATRGLADRADHTGADLSLRRFGQARALAYDWLFDGFDLAAGLRINEAVASRLIDRVIERRYLLAFLGIVPAKWARDTGTDRHGDPKPFPIPAYPVREVGEILERMGLKLKRREVSSTLTWGDATLGDITPSEGKRHYANELTGESWARMEALAERRNRRRATVGVRPADARPATTTALISLAHLPVHSCNAAQSHHTLESGFYDQVVEAP